MSRSQVSAYPARCSRPCRATPTSPALFLNQSSPDSFLGLCDQMLPSRGEGVFSVPAGRAAAISAASASPPRPRRPLRARQRLAAGDQRPGPPRGRRHLPGPALEPWGMVAGYEAMGDAGGALGVALAAVGLEEHGTVAKLGEEDRRPRSCRPGSTGGGRSAAGSSHLGGRGRLQPLQRRDRGFVTADIDGDGPRPTSASPTPPPGTAWSPTPSPAWPCEARLGEVYLRPEARPGLCRCARASAASRGGGAGFYWPWPRARPTTSSGDLGLVLGNGSTARTSGCGPNCGSAIAKTLAGAMGDTIASFAGGAAFSLAAGGDKDRAVTLGFALRAGSALSYLALRAAPRPRASRPSTPCG